MTTVMRTGTKPDAITVGLKITSYAGMLRKVKTNPKLKDLGKNCRALLSKAKLVVLTNLHLFLCMVKFS